MTSNQIFLNTIYKFLKQFNDPTRYALNGVYVKVDSDSNATIEASDRCMYCRRIVKADPLLTNTDFFIRYDKKTLELLKMKKTDTVLSLWIDSSQSNDGIYKLCFNKNSQELKIDIAISPQFKPPFDALEPKKLGHKIRLDFEFIAKFLEANPNFLAKDAGKFELEIDTQNTTTAPIKISDFDGNYCGLVMPMRK